MSNIINLLEQLATKANLLNEAEIEKLIVESQLDDTLKVELLNKNIEAIKEALNARAKVFCGIFPAEDDESEEKEEDNDESKESTQSKIAANS